MVNIQPCAIVLLIKLQFNTVVLKKMDSGSLDSDSLRRKRGVAKGKFRRKVKLFYTHVRKESSSEVLKLISEDIEKSFEEIESYHTQLIEHRESTVSDEEDQYMETLEYERLEIRCMIEKKLDNKSGNKKVKLKPFDPPRFTGNVRDWPTFKKTFDKLVVPQYGTEPYALLQCLESEAKELVRGVEDDFSAMMSRLEEEYSHTGRILESILGDIRKLKPIPEGANKSMIEAVNTIERCWLDLKKLNLESELSNNTNLVMIEKLLPPNLKREWIIIYKSLNPEDPAFPKLMEFMIRERSILRHRGDEKTTRIHSHSVMGEVGFETAASKTCVSSQTSNNPLTLSNVLEVIKEVRNKQVEYQRQVSEFIQNTNNAIKALSKPTTNSDLREQCWFHKSNNHGIQRCSTFASLSSDDKMQALRENNVCFSCLKPGHSSRNCRRRVCCEIIVEGGGKCGRMHHSLLHDVFRVMPSVTTVSSTKSRDGVLLSISYVISKGVRVAVLWDSGSDISIITHRMAKHLGLKAVSDMVVNVTKVGNQTEEIHTKSYIVPLMDLDGKIWEIEVCAMEEISSPVKKLNLSEAISLLDLESLDVSRPEGKLDLLIGSDYASLLPQVVKSVGNLQLCMNVFGYCIRGSHSSVQDVSNNTLTVQINHVSLSYGLDKISVTPLNKVKDHFENMLTVENLGIQYALKCGNCECGSCPVSGKYTMKEERELKLIEEGISYDSGSKRFTASYAFISNPNQLPNNYYQALVRLRSTEKRLKRLGAEYTQNYVDQMEDMVSRGVARKLSLEEVKSYKGPVFYLPHHEVLKPTSTSTPIRIVFNSSASYLGISLNDCLAKGPDVLSNMLGILLRFRQHTVAVAGDIRKMYNTILISERDQHCHRFLWRNMEAERDADVYVLNTVTFGDRPSSIIAILCLHQAASMKLDYQETGSRIKCDSYVDDILTSLPTDSEAKKFIEETEELLSCGGFRIKHWIISGNHEGRDLQAVNVLDSEEEKVLGLIWVPKGDHFSFKMRVNFSKKYKNVFVEPDIVQSQLRSRFPSVLTRRIVLSQYALVFDPLGILVPFTLQAKLMLRELAEMVDEENNKLGWDSPMPSVMYDKWFQWLFGMFEVEKLLINRCVCPTEYTGRPSLIIFCDASSSAVGCCAYVRWKVRSGKYFNILLAAKGKLAPQKQTTIPRLELNAAVLACRLRTFIVQEMSYDFEYVLHVTDSAIVRAQINNDKLRFSTYVAVRIAEIQSKSKPEEWYWTSSSNNPADLATRCRTIEEISYDSTWQYGPEYMKSSLEHWPISNQSNCELPDIVNTNVHVIDTVEVKMEPVIDVARFSSYHKLLRTTARVLKSQAAKSLLSLKNEPNGNDIEKAELWWIRQVQATLPPNWPIRFKRLVPYIGTDGIVKVGGRLQANNWNNKEFILIPREHPFTKLYVNHIHNIDHAGAESTLTRVQSKFWIPGVRRYVKSVRFKCVVCKKIDKRTKGQCMGPLPSERLAPAPPFYNCSCDIFGPFHVKDTIKKRITGKVYGVVFNCLITRAVYIDLAEGYDTESFLNTLRRFVAIHGFPKTMFSDSGSQLVCANKNLVDMVNRWNVNQITAFGSCEGMTWCFNKSADAPWENGCAESLIRLIKRALVLSVGSRIVTFNILQTAFFEIAALLNSRPIGIKPGSGCVYDTYLCPNDLLLGRSGRNVPPGVWDESQSYKKSFEFLQSVTNEFWRRWNRDFLPTLLIRQKWHHDVRNVRVGDIVIVQDSNVIKGEWKLAIVEDASPGTDGKVRDVTLRFGTKDNSQVIVKRSVHRIVVILPIEEQQNE